MLFGIAIFLLIGFFKDCSYGSRIKSLAKEVKAVRSLDDSLVKAISKTNDEVYALGLYFDKSKLDIQITILQSQVGVKSDMANMLTSYQQQMDVINQKLNKIDKDKKK